MNKWQKVFLTISIFECVHYAFSVLFHVHFFIDWLSFHNHIEFIYAFIVGLSGFINILLFHKN